jgi:AcrR family transcriptional regulator
MPKDTFLNLPGEKQEMVMRAAINEFMNKGFEKGNIGDIAKTAGIAKGSMYQYFENKRELFLYSVRWALELIMKKYSKVMVTDVKDINTLDYLYQGSKEVWLLMREEREVIIFIQDVFLGKFSSVKDESMDYMMKVADDYTLQLIRDGKKNGYIRTDIDDNLLLMFITGASMKMKEYIMSKARNDGEDIIDETFEANEKDFKNMIDLLKNGMGAK